MKGRGETIGEKSVQNVATKNPNFYHPYVSLWKGNVLSILMMFNYNMPNCDALDLRYLCLSESTYIQRRHSPCLIMLSWKMWLE